MQLELIFKTLLYFGQKIDIGHLMKPLKDEIQNLNRDEIAEKFKVSDKTVVRWLKHYGMFERKSRKLDKQKAADIREKCKNGISMKDLAAEYEVTFAAISRILNNITYKTHKKTYASVSVLYNP